jgi:hypothetical protein
LGYTGLENAMFRKQDLFPFSGEGMEIPTLLGLLERTNLSHWTSGRKQIKFPKRCVSI